MERSLVSFYDNVLMDVHDENLIYKVNACARYLIEIDPFSLDYECIELFEKEENGRYSNGKRFLVPFRVRRTSGIYPYLFFDNTEYTFNFTTDSLEKILSKKSKVKKKDEEKIKEKDKDVEKKHLSYLDDMKKYIEKSKDESAKIVYNFLTTKKIKINDIIRDDLIKDFTDRQIYIAFKIKGSENYCHESDPLIEYYVEKTNSKNKDKIMKINKSENLSKKINLSDSFEESEKTKDDEIDLIDKINKL